MRQIIEGGYEFFVRHGADDAAFALDDFAQAAAELRHAAAEFLRGALPVGDHRLGVGEEGLEDFAELLGLGVEVALEHDFAVLHEEGAAGLPEEGVFAGVAELELGAHLGDEVVGVILVLDDAVRDAVGVEQHGVEAERGAALAAGDGVFADEGPLERAGAVLDEAVPGFADGGFVRGSDVGELGQRGVVGADGRVGGFERKGRSAGARRSRRHTEGESGP